MAKACLSFGGVEGIVELIAWQWHQQAMLLLYIFGKDGNENLYPVDFTGIAVAGAGRLR
jgi:hypothetical protein